NRNPAVGVSVTRRCSGTARTASIGTRTRLPAVELPVVAVTVVVAASTAGCADRRTPLRHPVEPRFRQYKEGDCGRGKELGQHSQRSPPAARLLFRPPLLRNRRPRLLF
ncbi:unnamed protein product, partial [Ectocarpus sp. 13 AM-2016]